MKAKLFLSTDYMNGYHLSHFCMREASAILPKNSGPGEIRDKAVKIYIQMLKSFNNKQLLSFLFINHRNLYKQTVRKKLSRSAIFALLRRKFG